ncbi:F-box only protein 4 isoform X1 [Gadus chalcogrammus]|uniref:F-box only protein 4 isoform X1 n=1 Tax=Gadus chalcogrammus TaxID=1042646 RepID=UPI0024C42E6E|nr:F-box only protein 4 isoform X1 [Gadus chalcogrammus]
MEAPTEKLSESLVIRSLKRFRDQLFYNTCQLESDSNQSPKIPVEDASLLDRIPVDVQFLILTLLPPEDICRLGATSRYWRALVRDPLLWKYFLLRDMPHWSSIDHVTMPKLEALASDICSNDLQLEERVEGEEQDNVSKYDYMAEYMKGHPACRQKWQFSRPPYEVVTSFLTSLLPSSEPRYAMFGPGIEQLDVSMVTRLMHAPDVLPVAAIPSGRQINGGEMYGSLHADLYNYGWSYWPSRLQNNIGIGSGISYTYNHQHKLNILTLYSTNRAERDRARVGQYSVNDKLFTSEDTDPPSCPMFIPNPQVQEVCQAVSGFIYVANAEPGQGDGTVEAAKIQAMLSPAWGSTARPLLVLSCVSRERLKEDLEADAALRTTPTGARCRTPSVEMAQRLRLPQLPNPWMVQDTVAESLSGLLDGISWLLRYSGLRI